MVGEWSASSPLFCPNPQKEGSPPPFEPIHVEKSATSKATGLAWSILIDASAIVLTFISLTGLVLLFYLKLGRIPGLAVAIIGTIIVLALFLLGVP